MRRLIERFRKALDEEKKMARKGFFDVLVSNGVNPLPVRPREGYGSMGCVTALGAVPLEGPWGGGARARAAVARESLRAALRACGEDAARRARDMGGDALILGGMNVTLSEKLAVVMAWGEVMKGEGDAENPGGGCPQGEE